MSDSINLGPNNNNLGQNNDDNDDSNNGDFYLGQNNDNNNYLYGNATGVDIHQESPSFYINLPPEDIFLDTTTIDENVPAKSVVGTLSTFDLNVKETFTYALVEGDGDTDNAKFTINGNQLKINSSPDYETQPSYDIRVQTTDAGGKTYSKELTININDVNEDVEIPDILTGENDFRDFIDPLPDTSQLDGNEAVRFDFNADGVADILWRQENGTTGIWMMNNDGTLNETVDLGIVSTKWDIAGVDDFNADGVADILWHHNNGANHIWIMNDDGTKNKSVILPKVRNNWDIAGVDDFNGDGVADILWRHNNGTTGIWMMNDDGKHRGVNVGTQDIGWDVAGINDFNGDGVLDIFWRNESGANEIWMLNDDGTLNQSVALPKVETPLNIAGVEDFSMINNDGTQNQALDLGMVSLAWE